jgi:hypothetical protein
MKIRLSILTLAFVAFDIFNLSAQNKTTYKNYYQEIINAEKLITKNEYSEALTTLENVFDSYDFIFLRDYKVAVQLALYLGNKQKALQYLKLGVLNGWTLKGIKNNKYLKPLRKSDGWKTLKSQYDSLRSNYIDQLNGELRIEVRSMFKNDQKYAFSNLFKVGTRAKTRFANEKIIPQNEKQLARLNQILDDYGYPGEKIIGNWIWMSTILSHHNSISLDYVQKDTLYPILKPRLIEAIQGGEMSPYEYATIEDWYVAVKSARKEAAFGFLNTLSQQDLTKSNKLRQAVGMRSIETRNSLVDIQNKTGMNFYLVGEPWVKGKIKIANDG